MSMTVTVDVVMNDLRAVQSAASVLSCPAPQRVQGDTHRVNYTRHHSVNLELYEHPNPELVTKAIKHQMDSDHRESLFKFQETYTKELLKRVIQESGQHIQQVIQENGEEVWIVEGIGV